MGREEEGEQEAARLQQSTGALFCDRQGSGTAGLCCTSHLGYSFSSFSSPEMTAAQRGHTECRQRQRERGRGSAAKLAPDKSYGWVEQREGHWLQHRSWGGPRTSPSSCCRLHVRPSLPPTITFQAGKTPNRLLGSGRALSKLLLTRGDEPICIFPLKHGGMFLVTLFCALRFAPGLLVGCKSSENTCILPI